MFGRAKHQDTPPVCSVEGCEEAATSTWHQGYTWGPPYSGSGATIHIKVAVPMCDRHFILIRRIMGLQDSETTAPPLYVFSERDLEHLEHAASVEP